MRKRMAYICMEMREYLFRGMMEHYRKSMITLHTMTGINYMQAFMQKPVWVIAYFSIRNEMLLLLMQDTAIKDLSTMRTCIYGMVLKLFSIQIITFLTTGVLHFV